MVCNTTILAQRCREGRPPHNLPAHKVHGVREAIQAVGASLLYLPPYSPDFNPIEAFSKLKALLRAAAARHHPHRPTLWQPGARSNARILWAAAAAYPKKRLEVIIDNLNTHKKNEDWLTRHPLVTFHFTPTRASWLNQVEGWFSILQGQSLTGASFTSVQQLKAHMDAFIETYNIDAEPFVWTKSKVHQRRVKGRRLRDL